MANELNEFDKLIRETYEAHESPYEPLHWEELEKELNATAPSMLDYFKSISTGIAATGVIFVAMLFLFSDYTGKDKNEVVVEETVQDGSASESGSASISTHEDKAIVKYSEVEKSQNANLAENTPTAQEVDESSVKDSKLEAKNPTEGLALGQDEKKQTPAQEFKAESTATAPVQANVNAEKLKAEEAGAAIRKGCTGLTMDFKAPKEYGKDAKYLWNFGDGYFSNEANPSHTFAKEGVFDVSLSVTSKSSGQISSNVVQAMIEVEEAPVSQFEVQIADKDHLNFLDRSYRSGNSAWIVNGERIAENKNLAIEIIDGEKHEIVLEATNQAGCTDTKNETIDIVKAGNQFPKAFSTAYGTNYSPGAIVDSGEVIGFKVFHSNTGEEVQSSAGSKGWDGTNTLGEKVEKGTYVWVMLVESEDGLDAFRGAVDLR
jgi:PKD repeat protein